jgi:hypothetical protein
MGFRHKTALKRNKKLWKRSAHLFEVLFEGIYAHNGDDPSEVVTQEY